jgi:hypothetical protein
MFFYANLAIIHGWCGRGEPSRVLLFCGLS